MSFILFLSTIGMLILFGDLSSQQTSEEIFEKALYIEEAQGDLQKAIELYEQILRQFPENRQIAAKAQLHIGLCYEKLGFQEAPKAFQKVLDDFPEQKDVVKIAQEKLSVFLKAKAAMQKTDKEFNIRKVWAHPGTEIIGAPSPDGKYLSFVDWNTGDLAIRDLATGKNQRLTNKGSWFESREFALFSKWSPDSRQLVYNWYNKEECYDLRTIDIDIKEPRILYGNKDKAVYIHPSDWSPDGKNILVFLQEQMALVSTVNGNLTLLKTEGKRSLRNAYFSPDGRFIAFCSPTQKKYNHDIFLVSIDGTEEITLVEHPAQDLLMGWAPDGKNMLFVSDRTGNLGLWIMEVEGGKQKTDPVLIKSDMDQGSIPMGITQQGLFYYGIPGVKYDVYMAERDPDSGEILDVPKKAIRLFEGTNMSPAWSPDGKYLAYVSMRGSLTMPNNLRRNLLCVRSMETGEEQEFKTQFSSFPINWLNWSPDGRYLLVQANEQNNQGIYRIDYPSGRVTPYIMRIEGEFLLHSPQISTDNKTVFYVCVGVDEGKKFSQILARDVETGKERELYSAPLDNHEIALSPDGRQLALLIKEPKERILMLMPSTGGEAKEIYRFEQGGQNISMAWTPDGKHIIHSKHEPAPDGKLELWQVSVENGQSKKLGLASHGFRRLRSLSVHPHGRQVVFTSFGVKPSQSEIWVMENFLPKEK